MITDAHTHIEKDFTPEELVRFTDQNDLYLTASFADPEQYRCYKSTERIIKSFGIHPWLTDSVSIGEAERETLESCSVIGEIGLDSEWCSVDPSRQEKIFIQQLETARERGVPVILHTKGREERCADILQDFDLKILVHWFSMESGYERIIERFARMGAFFTIGPGAMEEDCAKRIVDTVPSSRILIETDGTEGAAWAVGRKSMSPDELPGVLTDTLEKLSAYTGRSIEETRDITNLNFLSFFSSGRS